MIPSPPLSLWTLLAGLTVLLPAVGNAQQPAAVPVHVGTVRPADVPVTLEGIGTVQAASTVAIRAQVDGILQEVRFREGQTVHVGDVLGQIDPGPFQAALDQALARQAQTEAQIRNARLNLQRYTDLARDDFASRQQLTNQQALVAQLQAQVQGDAAAVASARIQVAFTSLIAPIDGVAGLRLVDAGNLLRATEATTVVVITQIRPIDVVFTLAADALPEIRQAMNAGPLRVTALERQGTRPLGEGSLLVVNNEIDPATGQIRLKARLPNQDEGLWPGQFVSVRLLLRVEHDVPTVPSTALQRGPDGYWLYVVRPDSTVVPQPVQLRRIGGGMAVLDGGPPIGTRVVTAGQYRLQRDSRVVVAGETPTSSPR